MNPKIAAALAVAAIAVGGGVALTIDTPKGDPLPLRKHFDSGVAVLAFQPPVEQCAVLLSDGTNEGRCLDGNGHDVPDDARCPKGTLWVRGLDDRAAHQVLQVLALLRAAGAIESFAFQPLAGGACRGTVWMSAEQVKAARGDDDVRALLEKLGAVSVGSVGLVRAGERPEDFTVDDDATPAEKRRKKP